MNTSHSSKKLLIICGPTATGKTSLALQLGKIFQGVVISADSRQVYKGLDIGTGKDKPKGQKILGYDLAGPKQEFNVTEFLIFAKKQIQKVWNADKLPILVGGTGLYIKGLVDGIETAGVSKNERIRSSLEGKSSQELFEMLSNLNPAKAASLNISDKSNPRRLTRAIEVSLQPASASSASFKGIGPDASVLFIGLRAPKEFLFEKIKDRVGKRVRQGLEKEIRSLLAKGVNWTDQSMSSLGYKQWKPYFEGKALDKEEVINSWTSEEKKYAKRQLTWFTKDKRINWFDITEPFWQKSVENMVKKWYSQGYHASKN